MTLGELKTFFLVDGARYTKSAPCGDPRDAVFATLEGCTDHVVALLVETDRLQARVKALESSGASAFNAWRTSSDVIGAMHVLREVVGAEFVDGQRLKTR
jgi:hypothetical protein